MKSALLRHVDSDTLRHLADDDFDEHGVLKDGGRYRVPMRMMDSAKPMADGLSPPAHWNGWRLSESLLNDSKRQRDLELLYAERDAATENAWREDFPNASEGDVCTVRGADYPNDIGSPGHLRVA